MTKLRLRYTKVGLISMYIKVDTAFVFSICANHKYKLAEQNKLFSLT